ncbi:hypothetical protein [Clostridium sp.]|uniref:hypothetical protein n=1 Tax=Clostridium sp. TaxID=1506 RepID=UPI002FCA4B05
MKKITALLLASLLCISLISCKENKVEEANKNVIEKFAKDNGYTIGVNSMAEMGECDLKTKDEKVIKEIFLEKSEEYNFNFEKYLDKKVALYTCNLEKGNIKENVIFMQDIKKEKILGVAFYDEKESEDNKESKYTTDRMDLMETR